MSMGRGGILNYRKTAFQNYERKCEICDYKEYPEILIVHHVDEDRKNNNYENLQILCPNCHSKIHKKLIYVE